MDKYTGKCHSILSQHIRFLKYTPSTFHTVSQPLISDRNDTRPDGQVLVEINQTKEEGHDYSRK